MDHPPRPRHQAAGMVVLDSVDMLPSHDLRGRLVVVWTTHVQLYSYRTVMFQRLVMSSEAMTRTRGLSLLSPHCSDSAMGNSCSRVSSNLQSDADVTIPLHSGPLFVLATWWADHAISALTGALFPYQSFFKYTCTIECIVAICFPTELIPWFSADIVYIKKFPSEFGNEILIHAPDFRNRRC